MGRYQQLVFVVPAFNEAQTISKVVHALSELGNVIVVKDSSTDRTAEVANEAGADVLTTPQNRGYDGALSLGFAHVYQNGFSYMVTCDADGQHPLSSIQGAWELIQCD